MLDLSQNALVTITISQKSFTITTSIFTHPPFCHAFDYLQSKDLHFFGIHFPTFINTVRPFKGQSSEEEKIIKKEEQNFLFREE